MPAMEDAAQKVLEYHVIPALSSKRNLPSGRSLGHLVADHFPYIISRYRVDESMICSRTCQQSSAMISFEQVRCVLERPNVSCCGLLHTQSWLF